MAQEAHKIINTSPSNRHAKTVRRPLYQIGYAGLVKNRIGSIQKKTFSHLN
jgi:hypothetical protein